LGLRRAKILLPGGTNISTRKTGTHQLFLNKIEAIKRGSCQILAAASLHVSQKFYRIFSFLEHRTCYNNGNITETQHCIQKSISNLKGIKANPSQFLSLEEENLQVFLSIKYLHNYCISYICHKDACFPNNLAVR
jgi:hypothetical protein